MATKGFIGILREQALKRIMASAEVVQAQFDIAPPLLPANRDPEYQEAARLDAIANWLEAATTALSAQKAAGKKAKERAGAAKTDSLEEPTLGNSADGRTGNTSPDGGQLR